MFPRNRQTNTPPGRVTLDRLVHVPMNRTTSPAVARVLALFQNTPTGVRSYPRTHTKTPYASREHGRR